MPPGLRRDAIRFLVAATLLAALAAITSRRLAPNDIGVDDANIYFVYMRNLAEGHGLVYNVGGERVEGFTSLAWVLLGAPLWLLSERPERLLLAIDVVIVAAALAAAAGFADRRLGRAGTSSRRPGTWGVALLIWCLAPTGFALWTTVPLLETGLWSALVLLSALALLEAAEGDRGGRRLRWLCGLAVALVLTRPDGLAWAPLLAALLVLVRWGRGATAGAAVAAALPVAASAAVAIVALTAFRLVYFGYPLPNTYYAKVSSDFAWAVAQGLDYVRTFVTTSAVVPPALLATCWLALDGLRAVGGRGRPDGAAQRPDRIGGLVIAVLVGAGVAIPVALGGDHFEQHRFLQPAWPLLGMAVLMMARRVIDGLGVGSGRILNPSLSPSASPSLSPSPSLSSSSSLSPSSSNRQSKNPGTNPDLGRGISVTMALGFSALCYGSSVNTWNRPIRLEREFVIAAQGREAGAALERIFRVEPRPRVGVVAAGGFALRWPGETVDLLGLNNLRMGHSPGTRRGWKNHAAFSREVFDELAPELLLPSLARCDAAHALPAKQRRPRAFTEVALSGLLRDPAFARRYLPATLAIPGRAGDCVFLWARRDRASALGATPVRDDFVASGEGE